MNRLSRADLDPDPVAQFRNWLEEAVREGLHEPNAMTFSTAAASGRPSSRIVLLKAFDHRGLVFATSYESRKGAELAENPWGSLVCYWGSLDRQVRIEGRVEKTSAKESDELHRNRPLGSKLACRVSRQSRVIENRRVLEERLQELSLQLGDDVPRPRSWGGYRLVPDRWEFWQGRPHRLHDRLCYVLRDDRVWEVRRLAP